MKHLNNYELTKVSGGANATIWCFVVVGVVFLASVIYGFINPNKCEG